MQTFFILLILKKKKKKKITSYNNIKSLHILCDYSPTTYSELYILSFYRKSNIIYKTYMFLYARTISQWFL